MLTFVDTTTQNASTSGAEVTEMRDALTKARQANQEKDSFLSRMSHDMRTPLNAIIGTAQIMAVDDTLPPRFAEQVSVIRDNGNYLLGIINEILETSRISAGRMSINAAPIDEQDFWPASFPL